MHFHSVSMRVSACVGMCVYVLCCFQLCGCHGCGYGCVLYACVYECCVEIKALEREQPLRGWTMQLRA